MEPEFGGEEVTVGLDWEEVPVHRDELLLIGKLLTGKNHNQQAIKSLIIRNWNPKKKVDINDEGHNAFIFTFEGREDYDRVIRDSPWIVMGSLLVLKEWAPMLTIRELDMSRCLFWVQLHSLPRGAMSKKNLIRMGSRIGKVVAYEEPRSHGGLFRSFARVRVEIDLNKPFIDSFWIPRPGLPNLWVEVRYEKLQGLCFNCGKVGHDQRSCTGEKVWSVRDPTKDRYDASLGVSPVRAVAEVHTVEDMEEEEKRMETERVAREEHVQEKRVEGEHSDGVNISVRGGYGGEREKAHADDRMLDDVVHMGDPQSLSDAEEDFIKEQRNKEWGYIIEIGSCSGEAQNDAERLKIVRCSFRNEPRFELKTSPKRDEAKSSYYVQLPSDTEEDIVCNELVVVPYQRYEVELIENMRRINLKREAEKEIEGKILKKLKKEFEFTDEVTSPIVTTKKKQPCKRRGRKPKSPKICSIDKEKWVDIPIQLVSNLTFQKRKTDDNKFVFQTKRSDDITSRDEGHGG